MITPLRALSQEIKQSVERITQDLGTQMTVGIRSGDTTTKERAQQKANARSADHHSRKSSAFLATKGYDKIFKDCSAIVV